MYDSYVTDPRYQKYFTIAWTCTFALALILTLPGIARYLASVKDSTAIAHFGLYEDFNASQYSKLKTNAPPSPVERTTRTPRALLAVASLVQSFCLITLPIPRFLSLPFHRLSPASASCHPTRPRLPFSLGTLFAALLIPLLLCATLFPEAALRNNPNRFGFVALACVPPMFVLSSKNGAVQWLLGKGWTWVNFLHRWLGRAMVLMVLLHFYFWAVQTPDGQMSTFFAGTKVRRGIGALVFLLVIALSSAGPLRRWSYPAFFVCHYVGVLGFLVFVNRHTVYAQGWATYSVVAIYGLDIVGRAASLRVRWVEVEPLAGGMTRVRMTGLRGGWRGGQHVSVRVMFAPPGAGVWSAFRFLEAHPFSIANAPVEDGVINGAALAAAADGARVERGAELLMRSCGKDSWTGDLHKTAQAGAAVAKARAAKAGTEAASKKMHMLALVEGPYGGLGRFVQLEEENVLLVAGGSGMSFVVGVLDEVVGKRLSEGKGGRVEVVWAVKDRAHIGWCEESLRAIITAAAGSPAGLQVRLRIFLTCDPSLTAATDQHLTPDASTSSPTSGSTAFPALLALPRTQLIHARPALGPLVDETVDRALAPCGSCWPVCACGDGEQSGGMCGNDEEACCGGGLGEVGNARELLVEDEWKGEKGDKGEKAGEKAEVESVWSETASTAVGTLLGGQGGKGAKPVGVVRKACCSPKVLEPEDKPAAKSCCAPPSSTDDEDTDAITELPSFAPGSCCQPTPAADPTVPPKPAACGGGCCSSTGSGGACCTGGTEGQEEGREEGPLRVRTGGLAVVVCGPGGMVGEARNAVAGVRVGKQVRIGGVSFHEEHYSV